MDDIQYYLLIHKSTVDFPTMQMACQKSGCKITLDYVDVMNYKIISDTPMGFYYLGKYIGKIHAEKQFQ